MNVDPERGKEETNICLNCFCLNSDNATVDLYARIFVKASIFLDMKKFH